MTIIAGLLLGALILEHVLHKRQVDSLLAEVSHERQKLLDRIQHPEVRQVQAGSVVEHELPTDTAELAQVGLVVPDFVNVGGTD